MLVNYEIYKKTLKDFQNENSNINSIKDTKTFIENINTINCFVEENHHFFSTEDYSGYTRQFAEYLTRIKKDYRDFFSKISSNQHRIESEMKEFSKKTINDDKILKILSRISIKSKNLILLGPNGSGKTSFAVFLQQASQNIRIIPAFKPLYYKKDIHNAPSNTKISDYNASINRNLYTEAHSGINNSYNLFSMWDTLFSKQIIGIVNEHIEKALEYQKSNCKSKTVFESIKGIFEDIFPEIQIDIDSTNKVIVCTKNGINKYDINGLSDGERSALFYIGTILTAPNDSYIIVDEPENHLNPAIYNTIWDKLEIIREDCQYIYISHTMDFVNSRKNYEIMTITNFIYPSSFEFDFIDPYQLDFPSDLIMKLIGSKIPVLFCEGSKDSYDYKIYQVLYGSENLVLPVGSCDNVIKFTRLVKELDRFFNIQAKGIIDNDFLQNQEIELLKQDNIFTLKVNEVEMLLLDEILVKEVLIHKNSEDSISEIQKKFDFFKNELVNIILDNRSKVTNYYIKKSFDTYSSNKKIVNTKEINSIRQEIETFSVGFNFEEQLKTITDKLLSIEISKDYNECLAICNLKNEVLKGLCNKYIDNDYVQRAIEIIRRNPDFAKKILAKYIIS